IEVKKLQSQKVIQPIDTAYLARYLLRYNQINFEGFEETKTEGYIDTIKSSTPEIIYTVTDVNNIKQTIKLYYKPAHEGAEDYDGNKIEFDLDRLYGWLNDEDFVVIQYQIFDPLKKKAEDFMAKP